MEKIQLAQIGSTANKHKIRSYGHRLPGDSGGPHLCVHVCREGGRNEFSEKVEKERDKQIPQNTSISQGT